MSYRLQWHPFDGSVFIVTKTVIVSREEILGQCIVTELEQLSFSNAGRKCQYLDLTETKLK